MKHPEMSIKGENIEAAIRRLDDIVKLLRSDEGCPWDKVQTHESLTTCLLEEACEVIEAINNKDHDNLEEELGDVLLQIVFHAQLGENFDLKSVANRISDKMIARHPHVFLNKSDESVDTVLEKWENIKRNEQSGSWTENLKKIAKTLPALRRSYKIQEKAAKVGFDWESADGAILKVKEETDELIEAKKTDNQEKILEELGDLLFAIVNVARFLEVDPEDALNFTSDKFIKRFGFIEEQVKRRGGRMEDTGLKEMDKLWEEAKRNERLGSEVK